MTPLWTDSIQTFMISTISMCIQASLSSVKHAILIRGIPSPREQRHTSQWLLRKSYNRLQIGHEK